MEKRRGEHGKEKRGTLESKEQLPFQAGDAMMAICV
jgi:hypothetical protein